MAEPGGQSLRQRALAALARFVCAHALWIVVAAMIAAGASVAYTIVNLGFITDRNALVNPDAEFNRRFLDFIDAFGDQEWMLLVVAPGPGPQPGAEYNPDPPDAETRKRMKRAAAATASRLRERPDLFPTVLERVPPEDFGDTRMLHLAVDDLRAMEAQVAASGPMLERLAERPSFAGLLAGLRDNIDAGGSPLDEAATAEAGARLADLLAGLRDTLETRAPPPELFTFESTDPTVDEDGYFFIWEGRLLYVLMMPDKDQGALNQIAAPLAFARAALDETREAFPDLALGLTGRPVIYSDEMAASSRDMALATIFAVLVVGLMFVLAFRSATRPALAVLALVLALCWTFGATTLLIGHLNIFAMVFGVVLVGLGIDFGIHLLSHYRQGLSHGLSVSDTLAEVYGEIGSGTVIGAVTTAAALSTAIFTDFLGLAELGLICGVGIGFCLLAMLIVFPALLVLRDARRVGEGNPALRKAMRHIEQGEDGTGKRPARSRFSRVMALVVVLAALAGAGLGAARMAGGWAPFDYNLLRLNDPRSKGLVWEELLIRHDQRASYAVSVRPTPTELAELRDAYRPLIEQGIVRATESLLPEDEAEKRKILARIGRALPDTFPESGTVSEIAELRWAARRLQSALRELALRGDLSASAFGPAADECAALVALTRDRPEYVQARLAEIEPGYFAGVLDNLRGLKRDSAPASVTAATLPDALRARYIGAGPTGETLYALYIYPAKDVWEHEPAGEFNTALLDIDPKVTGVTIQVYESAKLIVAGFLTSVLYAFMAILLLLSLDLRRPVAVLVALLPLFCALAVLVGVMALTGLRFNFANFFAVPILIGTTVDAGVYLVHSQRHGDPRRTLRHTRWACLLCGLTTLLGFGALVTAGHLGVVSLGMVLVVGCAGGILGSFFLVPAILAWFNEQGRRV